MPLWLQHSLVIATAGVCLGFVVLQAARTLRSASGGFGSCCSKGCEGSAQESKRDSTVFIPSDSLGRKPR